LVAGAIQFRVDLALAVFKGERDQLVGDLERKLAEMAGERPALPPPPTPSSGD